MAMSIANFTLLCAITVLLLARPAHAFGAGNIASVSQIEGQNWRHGDIEDVLLSLVASRAMGGKKFSKLDVKRIYFGNWLRDYSQAVDVGTVKYVSAKAITLLLWVLGFMSFGYGTKEFEVTMERLGCYRPEEHIDNPKDYADNEDATRYDRRLRGPVNVRRELAIDPALGMKNYIASENVGITTSAGLVRKLFSQSIELGRRYARNNRKEDLYEALRLLGTGCHCLEDFSAHSNYVELALIEMGERNVFPHVGRNTRIQLRGARYDVYPLITGTFGGVDFLHSVTGEFDDKVTQSEIQELENTMNQAQMNQNATSGLQDLLNKLPSGMFGGTDEVGKADELKQNAAQQQMQNAQISPREPEQWSRYLEDARQQIYPIIQFHDQIMQGVTETIEAIPILPDLLENLQEQLNIFVFSLIAPFILPVINQIKAELNTGSSAIIESSMAQQHIVFRDDNSSDPTHSMLSKDHFSNVLNEPAGKVAGQVLRWAVPQLIAAWDDERIDINRTVNRIIQGVFHHPALRDYGDDGAIDGRRLMFSIVENWWQGKDEQEKGVLRDQLSREGVEDGRNHKPGVIDHGHGSGKPLGLPKSFTASSSGAPAGAPMHSSGTSDFGRMAGEAVGGGALGTVVGGLAGAIGSNILGGDINSGVETYNRTQYGDDGSRTQTVTQLGTSRTGERYGQAQYSRIDDSFGRTEQYTRYEQSTTGGHYQSEVHTEYRSSEGGYHEETRRFGDGGDSFRDDDETEHRHEKHHKKHHSHSEEHRRGHKKDESSDDDNDSDENRKRRSKHGHESHSRVESSSYGHEQEPFQGGNRYGAQETGYEGQSFGRQQEDTDYASSGRHRRQEDTESYGNRRQEEYGGGYGRQQESSYGGGFGRQQETSYGGGYGREEVIPARSYNNREEYSQGGEEYGENDGRSYGRRNEHEYGRNSDNEENRGYGGYQSEQRYGRRSGGYEDE